MHACVLVLFTSGCQREGTVYSLRETSRLFGASLCLASVMKEKERREQREREEEEEEEEEVGQGRNVHSEAQIDAKQLLNSCKVEQLLGRRGERDGGDERSRKRQRDPGDMLKY